MFNILEGMNFGIAIGKFWVDLQIHVKLIQNLDSWQKRKRSKNSANDRPLRTTK